MKKFTKRYVFYKVLISLFICLFLITEGVIDFLTQEEEITPVFENKLWVFLIIFFVGSIIYYILYYYSSGYEFNEKMIVCKRGVIFKKRSELLYENIHAINKQQGIIQKIFGVSVLMIDSGSTNTIDEEIRIYEDKEIVDQLYNRLKGVDNDCSKTSIIDDKKLNNSIYSFSTKNKFIYSLLNSFGGAILIVISLLGIMITYSVINTKQSITSAIEVFGVSLGIGIIILLIFFIASVIEAFLKYYNFQLLKNKDEIEINYGLFVNVHNSFKINRVKAIIIKQGLIKRLFGFVTVKVEVIGYKETDNNESNVGVLIPLCRKSEVDKYISEILPIYVGSYRQSTPINYKSFILWKLFILSVSSILIYIPFLSFGLSLRNFNLVVGSGITLLIIYLLVLIYFLIDAFLEYKSCGMCIEKNKITLYRGGFIQNVITIQNKDLIAIEDITTPLRAKKGIYSYKIHFYTNANTNVIKVEMQDEKLKEELLNTLKD